MKTFNCIPSFLIAAFLFIICDNTHAQIITTVAGSSAGTLGDGGPATAAQLNGPTSIAFDAVGNYYITDDDHNLIRKVNTAGIITTFAGLGGMGFTGDNGPATAAKLNHPYGIALDAVGNIYFTDNYNERIRKIDGAGIITTIAGTATAGYNGDNIPATTAALDGIGGIAIDASGNIYFSENYNQRIRKINSAGIITTIAGNGTAGYNGDEIPATNAEVNKPNYVAIDKNGNIYIADLGNHRIRKIDGSGIIHTIAGNGTPGHSGDGYAATGASLNQPGCVYIDNNEDIYIADSYNNVIRKILANGIITTIAGTGTAGFGGDGGFAMLAEFIFPVGITMDAAANLYIADWGNSRIRCIKNTAFTHTVNNTANINLYPNPCNGLCALSISTDIAEPVDISIANAIGQQVTTFKAMTNTPVSLKLDERAGLYFISAATAIGTQTARLVITQ